MINQARRGYIAKWQREHSKERNAQQRESRKRNPTPWREHTRKYRAKLKAEAIAEFGGKCECCGESNPYFLTLDHKNGGGTKERKKLMKMGKFLSSWKVAKDEGYPKDKYALACYNCNCGREANDGVCPHKISK